MCEVETAQGMEDFQGVGGERGILNGGKRVTGSARDLATCKYHALFVDEKENK